MSDEVCGQILGTVILLSLIYVGFSYLGYVMIGFVVLAIVGTIANDLQRDREERVIKQGIAAAERIRLREIEVAMQRMSNILGLKQI